jgi:hypothetical protein
VHGAGIDPPKTNTARAASSAAPPKPRHGGWFSGELEACVEVISGAQLFVSSSIILIVMRINGNAFQAALTLN